MYNTMLLTGGGGGGGGGGEEPIIAATKYEFRNNLGSSLDSMNLPGMEPSM